MPFSKAKKQRQQALEKARANNSNNNLSLNDTMSESQLEIIDDFIEDVTPDNLIEPNEQCDTDADLTPENLESSRVDQDPDFTPLPAKLMIIPDTF